MFFTAASSVIFACVLLVVAQIFFLLYVLWMLVCLRAEKNQTWGDSIALSACEAGNQWVLALQLFEFMKATNDVCFWAENYLV